VGKSAIKEFDPQAFLAKVGAGKTILNIKKNQHVFERGDVADTVFYIQKGRVKLTELTLEGASAAREPAAAAKSAANMTAPTITNKSSSTCWREVSCRHFSSSL
jgi:hypothetical protein